MRRRLKASFLFDGMTNPPVFVSLALLAMSAAALVQKPAASPPIVLTHVAVIDVTAADSRRALRLDQTVVISGDRIVAVDRAGEVPVPRDAQVIDATGQFLMPGLWDMHVHIFAGGWDTASVLDLFLAHGVTGVRDMGSNVDRVVALRDEIASGARAGPRMVVSGPSVSGLSGTREAPRSESAENVRREVRRLKEARVDFIKLYSYLSPAAFLAAMDEARQVGLPAAGHVPFAVKASAAARAGLRSIEHLEGVVLEATDLEEPLREEIALRIREGTLGIQVPEIEVDQAVRYRDSYNVSKLQTLSAEFVTYDTWHCPTLISPEAFAHVSDAMQTSFASYPNIEYVPGNVEEGWKRALSGFSREQSANIGVYAAYKRVLTAAMHRAGAQFLAGTDAAGPGQVPGASLHEELALLVEVGLSPMQALRTATASPARFLGRENDLGAVEQGYVADLVLLDDNPLDDIHNTRHISAVILNGRYFGKGELQAMLEDVVARARR